VSKRRAITILAAIGDDEARDDIEGMLAAAEDMEVVGTPRNGEVAVSYARNLQPDIFLVDDDLPKAGSIETIETITTMLPGVGVILLSREIIPDVFRRAMSAGVRDVLPLPPDPEELLRAIYRVHDATAARRSISAPVDTLPSGPREGQTIAVFSPKGGVGCTTIAVNLAVAIRQEAGLRVALVDGSLPFGDIGVFMDLPPTRSIMDLQAPDEQMDAELVDQALVTHERSGVKVLLSPQRPEMSDMVTGELLRRALTRLRERNEYVIVDTWSALDERVLTSLEAADKIILVVSLELSAIKSAKVFLEVADLLKFPHEKILPVISRSTVPGGVSVADVEAVLGRAVSARIPSDERATTRAINEGDPIMLANRAHLVPQAIAELARRIVSENYPEAGAAETPTVLAPVRGGRFRLFARG